MSPGWRSLFTRSPEKDPLGKQIERAGARYLCSQGLELVTRNYHCRRGEIDLVMREQQLLVFVEVRYRTSAAFGSPAESVTRAKQRKLIAAAQHYIASKQLGETLCYRFDVLAVTASRSTKTRLQFSWIQDAFQPDFQP